MAKGSNFYRRDPGKALAGMASLTLEEKGVYTVVLDLMYLTWRPVEDNPKYIAAHCGCAVQKLNPILRSLVAKGKLIRFDENGQTYLSNDRFDEERLAVKGEGKTRSGRGEVGEKSPGVGNNPPICEDETEEKQPVTALEKIRVEENVVEERAREIDKPFLDRLETRLREAAGAAINAASPGLLSLAPVLGLLRPGQGPPCELEADVLPAIRAVAAKAKPGAIVSWGYFAAAICKARDERLSGAGPSTAPTPTSPREWAPSRWRAAIEHFAETGKWGDAHGPRPGQPGCWAPGSVLAEAGYPPPAVGEVIPFERSAA